MEIKNNWVNFKVTNVSDFELVTINKKMFEEIVGDRFIAVKVNDKDEPVLIWTEKYVCPIKIEVLFDDCPVMIFPRSPF